MKSFFLFLLLCIPFGIQAMLPKSKPGARTRPVVSVVVDPKIKKKPALAPSDRSDADAQHPYELAAFNALKACDVKNLKGFMEEEGFDINYYFVEKHPQLHLKLESRRTLLAIALSMNMNGIDIDAYANCLRAIIERPGLDVHTRDINDWAPLHIATWNDSHLPLSTLLEYKEQLGLDLNERCYGGWTPLNVAAERGHVFHAKLLLEHPEVKVNPANENGETPLHQTAVSRPAITTKTDLQLAEITRNTDRADLQIMEDLCERGACTEACQDGNTVFTDALAKLQRGHTCPSKVIGLLACGCLTHSESFGSLEEHRKHVAGLPHLLDKVKLHIESKEGAVETQLLQAAFIAALTGSTLAEGFGLKKGSKFDVKATNIKNFINARDVELGMTALHWAAARANILLAEELIALGADPLAIDVFGNTPLHRAVMNGYPALTAYLTGIKPSALLVDNKNRRKPVDLAESVDSSAEIFEALAYRPTK